MFLYESTPVRFILGKMFREWNQMNKTVLTYNYLSHLRLRFDDHQLTKKATDDRRKERRSKWAK